MPNRNRGIAVADPEVVEANNTPFGSFKISSANLNTLVTILSFSLILLVTWTLYAHAGDAKDGTKAVASALLESNKEVATALRESSRETLQTLKEMARATRENNCLLGFEQSKRQPNAEFCKKISQ
jgi:hypothetical protein